MSTFIYKDKQFTPQEGQSVLETLLEGGESIAYACQQGVCQSCVLKAPSENVPAAAQIGLKSTQQEQGYFLSCLCKFPESDDAKDIMVSDADDLGMKIMASVESVQQLTKSIYKVCLKVDGDFSYEAGQYVNLIRPFDQLTRSYSLASVQGAGSQELEFHIKVFPGGEMSQWLSKTSKGDEVALMGPMGDCFYSPSFQSDNLLLLGYGTGLAPLYGILTEALLEGHKGEIHLYQWGNDSEDLYYQEKIKKIAEGNKKVFYKIGFEAQKDERGNVVARHLSAEDLSGDACALIQQDIPSLKNWKIFLCGSEAKVNKARRIFYLSGADLSDIYADAFFTWQASEEKGQKAS